MRTSFECREKKKSGSDTGTTERALKDHETPRDTTTTRPRDRETARPRDHETARHDHTRQAIPVCVYVCVCVSLYVFLSWRCVCVLLVGWLVVGCWLLAWIVCLVDQPGRCGLWFWLCLVVVLWLDADGLWLSCGWMLVACGCFVVCDLDEVGGDGVGAEGSLVVLGIRQIVQ